MNAPVVRLTSLAHGGGCGCKLAPSVLQQLLADQPLVQPYRELLVGTETGDDAAVWQLDDDTCIIATTDFFMPMVDDPFDFGRIAATNAISDVYAMGGRPIMALAILGMPVDKVPPAMVREILKGGAQVCASAGIPVAGGHSIDSPEPIYGLAVIGLGRPSDIRRNTGAQPGDELILTKALGVGIYSAAFKKDALSPGAYAEMVASMTLLNRIGADLAKDPSVHAITDVTGFGFLGHALGMARGSHVALSARFDDLATALGGRGFGAAAFYYRRFGAELGELRRKYLAAGRLSRLAARFAHRSADLGRSADRLRSRSCRENYQHDYRQRVSPSPHHRTRRRRTTVNHDQLVINFPDA